MKHYAFLKNVCYHYLNFALWVNYCFLATCWLAQCILLFTCDLIGQLYLRWPWSQYSHCSFVADVCVIKNTVHKQLTQQVTLSMLIIETFSSLTRSTEKDFFTKNHETWTGNQTAANAQKHVTGPLDLMMLFFLLRSPTNSLLFTWQ